jgi:hypothetical protein
VTIAEPVEPFGVEPIQSLGLLDSQVSRGFQAFRQPSFSELSDSQVSRGFQTGKFLGLSDSQVFRGLQTAKFLGLSESQVSRAVRQPSFISMTPSLEELSGRLARSTRGPGAL